MQSAADFSMPSFESATSSATRILICYILSNISYSSQVVWPLHVYTNLTEEGGKIFFEPTKMFRLRNDALLNVRLHLVDRWAVFDRLAALPDVSVQLLKYN